jgi:hypothetical protein
LCFFFSVLYIVPAGAVIACGFYETLRYHYQLSKYAVAKKVLFGLKNFAFAELCYRNIAQYVNLTFISLQFYLHVAFNKL